MALLRKETCNLRHPMRLRHHVAKCSTLLLCCSVLQCVAEYRLFYRSLLQKRPVILRSLLIVATPYCTFGNTFVWHDSCGCAWDMCGIAQQTKTKETYILTKRDLHTHKKKASCNLTQMYCRKCCMGWLRLVGSLKLQVSFVKETYKKDYILQKRPIIWRRLLIVSTPQ